MGKNDIEIRLRLSGKLGKQIISQANIVKGQNKKMAESFDKLKSSSTSATSGIKRLILAAGGLYLFTKVGKAFVSAGTEVENLTTQFRVLLKSTEAAKDRMAELAKFAQTTPFQLEEVAKASRLLQVLTGGALATGDSLRMVGDAAAAAGTQFDELAMWVGRAYSGLQANRPVGEAMMRLTELGILTGEARNQIENLQKAGKGTEAWSVLRKELDKSKGGMEALSKTVSGLHSTIKDQLNEAMRQMMKSGVWDALRDAMTSIVALLNKAIDDGLFERWGKGIATIIEKVKELYGLTGGGRDTFLTEVKDTESVRNYILQLQRLNSEINALTEARKEADVWYWATKKEADLTQQIINKKSEYGKIVKEINKIAGEGYIRETSNLNMLLKGLDSQVQKLEKVEKKKIESIKTTPIGEPKEEVKGTTIDYAAIMRERGQEQVALQYEIDSMLIQAQQDSRQKELALAEQAQKEKLNILLNENAKNQEYRLAAEELYRQQIYDINKKWNALDLAESKRLQAAKIAGYKQGARAIVNTFELILGENKGFRAAMKTLQISEAIGTTALNAVNMFKAGTQMPFPLNTFMPGVLMANAIAAGAAQIATIRKAATGADFETRGPQMMIVGDNPGGRERVQVTPLSSPNTAGPRGSPIAINVNLYGPVTDARSSAEIIGMTVQEKLREISEIERERVHLQI